MMMTTEPSSLSPLDVSGTTVRLDTNGTANEALLTVCASVKARMNPVGEMLLEASTTVLASIAVKPLTMASNTIVVPRRCAADDTEQPGLYCAAAV